jgi:hypothetical protein
LGQILRAFDYHNGVGYQEKQNQPAAKIISGPEIWLVDRVFSSREKGFLHARAIG